MKRANKLPLALSERSVDPQSTRSSSDSDCDGLPGLVESSSGGENVDVAAADQEDKYLEASSSDEDYQCDSDDFYNFLKQNTEEHRRLLRGTQ
jgi:hypothetical protein